MLGGWADKTRVATLISRAIGEDALGSMEMKC